MGKKGPPYDDDPGAIYVVIEWPWGAKRRERMTQSGANSIGAWVRYMLRRPDADDILVDMVYSRTTVGSQTYLKITSL
jgi:hypothetical protein